MKPGEWVSDPAARGAGRLQVRKLASGELTFYYRYTTTDGARDRLPLGTGLDLRDARSLAAELSRRYQSGERNLRDALDREANQKQQDDQRANQIVAERKAASLGALLDAYVEELWRAEKSSADKVGKSLRCWRLLKTDQAIRLKIDQGKGAERIALGCG